jgi:hypothetical protein
MSFDNIEHVYKADFNESECTTESLNKVNDCEDNFKSASLFVEDTDKMIWDLDELE